MALVVKNLPVPEPEDAFPMMTWILGYFWSLPRGVSPRLVWGNARAISSPSLSKLQDVDRKAWRAAVHGVPKSRTRLGDLTTAIEN